MKRRRRGAPKGGAPRGRAGSAYHQASYPPPPAPVEKGGRHRAEVGPRRAALQGRKRRRLRRQSAAGVTLSVLLGLLAAGGAIITVNEVRQRLGPDPAPAIATADDISTTLLFGTRERRGGSQGGAVWISLLYNDPTAGKGGVIYLPAHTAAEIPGRGLQPIGGTLSSGGIALLLVSIENMLGVGIDSYVELSDRDARVFFQATGPLSIDVPSEVRVGAGADRQRLLLTEGPQLLDPTFLEKLLYVRGLDADDVDLGARHLTFWDGLFRHFAEDPAALAAAVNQAAVSFGESDAGVARHAEMMRVLASLPYEKRTIALLPVNQVGVGGQQLYHTDGDELLAFVDEALGAASLTRSLSRVQILNGNGVPGIGQIVANKLVGQGFRVILSGNARRLNYKKTLIVTYDSSAAGLALAERARELLGVGEVQVSVQQQGIVELTIVVGKDFVRHRSNA